MKNDHEVKNSKDVNNDVDLVNNNSEDKEVKTLYDDDSTTLQNVQDIVVPKDIDKVKLN